VFVRVYRYTYMCGGRSDTELFSFSCSVVFGCVACVSARLYVRMCVCCAYVCMHMLVVLTDSAQRNLRKRRKDPLFEDLASSGEVRVCVHMYAYTRVLCAYMCVYVCACMYVCACVCVGGRGGYAAQM